MTMRQGYALGGLSALCDYFVCVQGSEGVPSGLIEFQHERTSVIATGGGSTEREALIRAAREWGYFSGAIKSRRDLWQGRRILDIGMGGGPHSISFIEGGAASYTGVDPLVGTTHVRDFRNLKDPSIPAYHAFDFSTQEIMRIYPNIKLYQGLLEDVAADVRANKADVAMMAAVTEHLERPYEVIRAIWRCLEPGGLLWISHCNYYSWTGHHRAPRDVASWKRDDAEQAKHVDWRHLEPSHPDYSNRNFNRVRVQDLRDIIGKYFEIIEWSVSVEGLARLTPEIRHRWRKYTLDELLSQNIYITGRRRDVPLGLDLATRPFHHPPEDYLAKADYSSEPLEPYLYANSVYISAANELCSHTNNDTAGVRVFERLRPGDQITLVKFTNRLPATVQEILRPAGGLPRLRLVQAIGGAHLQGNHDQWSIAEFGPGAANSLGVSGCSETPAVAMTARPAQPDAGGGLIDDGPPAQTARETEFDAPAVQAAVTIFTGSGSGPHPGAPLRQAIDSALAKYGRDKGLEDLLAGLSNPGGEIAYEALQSRHRPAAAAAIRPDGQLKYLDLPYWIGHKYALAKKLGLHQSPPLSLLDLGTGPAHLLFVARALGHTAVGLDAANAVYDEIAATMGVTRAFCPIVRGVALPDLGARFDLVTSIWINYDQWPENGQTRYWPAADWAFLLNHIAGHHLKFPGRIYLELNQQKRPDGGYAFDSGLLRWFETQGAAVDLNSGTVDFRLDGPRSFA